MKKIRAPKKTAQVVSTKHLPAAGSEPALSAKIGGVSNTMHYKNEKKGK